MQDLLYKYLVLNNSVSLPGIGTILIERKPSLLDYGNKQFLPPVYTFRLDSQDDQPARNLFQWLSLELRSEEWECIRKVNEFSFELKDKLARKGKTEWKQVGSFRRNETGEIILEPAELTPEQPVVAEKVIRQHKEHALIVGDEEKTSVQMEEYFSVPEVSRDIGWVIAIVLAMLSLMYTGFYFSQNGLSFSSAGNQAGIF